MTASAVNSPSGRPGGTGASREIDVLHGFRDERCRSAPPADARAHHLRPRSPGESGIVLDLGGDRELSAGLQALDHDRLEIGARGVEGRSAASRPGTDDDDAVVGFLRWHGAGRISAAGGIPAPAPVSSAHAPRALAQARRFRHHDLHRDDAARERARRDQPLSGISGLRRAGVRARRRPSRRSARGTASTPA